MIRCLRDLNCLCPRLGMWLTSPNDSKPSVSLTLLVLSFLGCLGLIITSAFLSVPTETLSAAAALVVTTAGLYFGRTRNDP